MKKRKTALRKIAKKPAKKFRKAKTAKKPKKQRPMTNVDIYFEGKGASLAELTRAIKLVQVRPIVLDASFRKKLSEKLGVKEEQLLQAAKKIIAGLKKK